MSPEQASYLITILKEWGVYFQDGLSDDEFHLIEKKFDINFPPDLRLFLSIGLPVSGEFINWRQGLTVDSIADKIYKSLDWPLEGLIFDIRENGFWDVNWGEKPNTYGAQIEIVLSKFKRYPKLIPIYSHRYIPSSPSENGNPIFSVYGTDIIYYGYDLATYLAEEFHFSLPHHLFKILKKPKPIEFWGTFDSTEIIPTTLLRTTSTHEDYRKLVFELDKDLAQRDGDDAPFFAQYNKSNDIKHVIVAYMDNIPVGSGAIKHYADGVIEVKRMYVLPAHRGNGIASTVLRELEAWARELGYHKAILETGKKMVEAIRVYEKNGYTVIPNYGPYAGVDASVCFEKVL